MHSVTTGLTSATGRESDRLIHGVELKYRQGQIGLNPESNQWVKYIYETGQCPVVQDNFFFFKARAEAVVSKNNAIVLG